MTGYPISKIIEQQVCLLDWPNTDWDYDPYFDVVFVREGTKLFTYLALALN
jgi:hypothetical protein